MRSRGYAWNKKWTNENPKNLTRRSYYKIQDLETRAFQKSVTTTPSIQCTADLVIRKGGYGRLFNVTKDFLRDNGSFKDENESNATKRSWQDQVRSCSRGRSGGNCTKIRLSIKRVAFTSIRCNRFHTEKCYP